MKTLEEIMNEVLSMSPEEIAERNKPHLTYLDVMELQDDVKPMLVSAASILDVAIRMLIAKNLHDIADKLIYADEWIKDGARKLPKLPDQPEAKVVKLDKK